LKATESVYLKEISTAVLVWKSLIIMYKRMTKAVLSLLYMAPLTYKLLKI